MDTYKLLPIIYCLDLNKDHFCIYNPINHNFIFLKTHFKKVIDSFKSPTSITSVLNRFQSMPQIEEIINQLKINRILIQSEVDFSKEIQGIGKHFSQQNPQLKLAYAIISEQCNLACKYCFVKGGTPPNYLERNMSATTAYDIARFVANNASINNESPPSLTFYGGEPLLNIPALVAMTDEIRKSEKDGAFGESGITITLVTNGTLMTDEIAHYLVGNNISVSVSIDGLEGIHNSARQYPDGRGSFDDALNGYKLVRDIGGKPSISCTISKHNIDKIDELADFLISLHPNAVGFNIMRSWLFGENIHNIPVKESTEGILRAFELLREAGIYEDRIMRRLGYIVKNKIRPYDCAGCGDQLVFLENGDYGPCHAFYPTRKYFFGNIYEGLSNLSESAVLQQWRRRTPFMMPQCSDCPFISICGGGCGYEAEIRTGSFWEIDETCCEHCKPLIDWCMHDLFNKISFSEESSHGHGDE